MLSAVFLDFFAGAIIERSCILLRRSWLLFDQNFDCAGSCFPNALVSYLHGWRGWLDWAVVDPARDSGFIPCKLLDSALTFILPVCSTNWRHPLTDSRTILGLVKRAAKQIGATSPNCARTITSTFFDTY